ncbi:MAG: endonuclease/exonuclease/phosphatase family protein [Balneolaceae bacterium]|nr:endonuclease/exonuclease/phosphatase family protein [Balneolaceae bacterium]
MKKSKFDSKIVPSFSFLLPACFILLVSSCNFEDVSGPEPSPPGPDPDPDPPADTVGTVPPDGVLETVTWNLEWYGTVGNGPSDEDLQTNNALKVIDSLKADLYALQEIHSQRSLDSLTSRMKGYSGFVADHISYNQRTAFIFNTQTIDSISSGSITEFQDDYDWAGRFPLYFRFEYNYEAQGIEIPIYAIVIHSKCCDDQESYQRRMRAAESLYTYLTRNEPETNIIILGDYNDDVDESIYQDAETPYDDFVDDEANFFVVTKSLSQKGQSSTVDERYPDTIDHITVSDEMEPFYRLNSEAAFTQAANFIDQYGTTTSDHYPVIAKFDVRL